MVKEDLVRSLKDCHRFKQLLWARITAEGICWTRLGGVKGLEMVPYTV